MSAPGNKRKADNSRDDWETPNELFDLINEEFYFSLDGAATRENRKALAYFGDTVDAFKMTPARERIWLNPPYGQGINLWIELARRWYYEGNNLVALLLPASTASEWWQEIVREATVTKLLSPRVPFVHASHCTCQACAVGKKGSNTGDSSLIILAPGLAGLGEIRRWRWRP